MIEDEIVEGLKKVGAEVGNWYDVSERPGKKPFGKEVEYKIDDIMWGKVHLRIEGDIYIHVISKIPFNWKDRVKDLKISGEIEDSAGGLLWIKEDPKNIEKDMNIIKQYLLSIKK